jgi:hypothetical protein
MSIDCDIQAEKDRHSNDSLCASWSAHFFCIFIFITIQRTTSHWLLGIKTCIHTYTHSFIDEFIRNNERTYERCMKPFASGLERFFYLGSHTLPIRLSVCWAFFPVMNVFSALSLSLSIYLVRARTLSLFPELCFFCVVLCFLTDNYHTSSLHDECCVSCVIRLE